MAPKGIPQALNTRIGRLALLLKNLPHSLPILPLGSCYSFGLDSDDIEQEGFGYAFNHNLEIVFETYKNPGPTVTLNQRGPCYDSIITMFRKVARALPPAERDSENGHLRRWLERLILAAELAGAKIPAKR